MGSPSADPAWGWGLRIGIIWEIEEAL